MSSGNAAIPVGLGRMLKKSAARLSDPDEVVEQVIAEEDLDAADILGDDAIMENVWGVFNGCFKSVSKIAQVLPAGVYECFTDDYGNPMFRPKDIKTDALVELGGGVAEKVIAEVETFWSKEERYKQAGLVFKRGVLMHGPQGCGKTSVNVQIINKLIEMNGIILLIDHPGIATVALQHLRELEPDRPLICVYEELDTFVRGGHEQALLTLLDGENQVDNVLHLATTNYFDRIPTRIRCRPSRFDLVIEMGFPGEDVRRGYVEFLMSSIAPEAEADLITEITALTRGMSFADLKEVVVSTYILAIGSLEDRVKYVTDLIKEAGDDSGEASKF